jgi:predicted RNase H-like HicB family nuclease
MPAVIKSAPLPCHAKSLEPGADESKSCILPDPSPFPVDDRSAAMKLRIVLEPSNEGGFTALVPSLPGCISEGDTREEALKNIREAIELYLEPVDDDTPLSARSEIAELVI